MRQYILFLLLIAVVVCGCSKKETTKATPMKEDVEAKASMQGIWINYDDQNIAFRMKGDSIYYPDTISQPIRFAVYGDTLLLKGGGSIMKYVILNQTASLLEYKSQADDVVKLIKSEDDNDTLHFCKRTPVVLNQRRIVKSDSIILRDSKRYHSYVQVNPTTFKVYKTSYNDEGLEVENLYYDNTVHVSLFCNGIKKYSRDFSKRDFEEFVPKDFLRQSILSNMPLRLIDDEGLHFHAELVIPDTSISYIVDVILSLEGKMRMRIQK